MKFTRLAVIVLALATLLTARADAEETTWSWKKLIPTIGKEDSPSRGVYPPPEEPSLWQKMNNGTKAMLAKTKELVPPWLMPGTQRRVRKSGNVFQRSTRRIREELRTARRNILAPWTQPDPVEDQPQTVTDWLGQEKPR